MRVKRAEQMRIFKPTLFFSHCTLQNCPLFNIHFTIWGSSAPSSQIYWNRYNVHWVSHCNKKTCTCSYASLYNIMKPISHAKLPLPPEVQALCYLVKCNEMVAMLHCANKG